VSGFRATTLRSRTRGVLIGVVFAIVTAIVGSPAAVAQGAWVVVPSSNTSGTEQNVLNGVTCVSSSHCWAVGSYFNSSLGLTQTLIEEWDGSSWSITNSPNVTGQFQELRSVTCVSDTECWAVGSVNSSPMTTLILRWDGTSWSIVSSPDLGEDGGRLFGVTCASASTCFAVGSGSTSDAPFGYPLIEEWDGVTWSAVRPPTPAANQGALIGVSCASRSRCWAVGQYFTGSNGVGLPLVERWNGKSWSFVNSPSPSDAFQSTLVSVVCPSRSKCWAVGTAAKVGGDNATLIEKWSGGSWSIVPSPNSSRSQNFLTGVSCVGRSDCWAIGATQDVSGILPALIAHWDGSSWSLVSAPITTRSLLAGVTCQSSGCWAVGSRNDGGQDQTLILHTD
jgi:hypothetical protein